MATGKDVEIPENDGKQQLRKEIHKILHSKYTHEEQGSALRDLMTQPYRTAAGTLENENDSQGSTHKNLKPQLPPNTLIAPMLEELPVELVEGIALNLDAKDFYNLRLASKTLMVKSMHYFRKQFFTRRCLLMDWNSLRKFVILLNDPVLEIHPVIQHVSVKCPELIMQQQLSPRNRWSNPHPPNFSPLAPLLDRVFGRIQSLKSLEFVGVTDANGPRRYLPPSTNETVAAQCVLVVLDALAQGVTKLGHLSLGCKLDCNVAF